MSEEEKKYSLGFSDDNLSSVLPVVVLLTYVLENYQSELSTSEKVVSYLYLRVIKWVSRLVYLGCSKEVVILLWIYLKLMCT